MAGGGSGKPNKIQVCKLEMPIKKPLHEYNLKDFKVTYMHANPRV